MFEDLSNKFERAIQSLSGQSRITDVNIADTVREIRRALLDADVSYEVAREFTANVRDKALGEGVLTSVNPGQQFTKIVFDELVDTLGATSAGLQFAQKPPTIILIAGLQGSGKTTFSAKLARHLREESKRAPLLVAADVYRPAAVDQLKTLGESIQVPVVAIEAKDAIRAAKEGVATAKALALDTVIIDTAGRMHVDEAMMQEVATIRNTVGATQTLFVVDAMTGQDAVNTAKEFHDRLDFDGVVLTKMDGDTRGGAALSIRKVVHKPIMFIGTGEKTDALTAFHPDRMAQRILGMGDVVSLVEKAQKQYNEKQAIDLRKKISSQSFDLNDFLDQIDKIRKMGNMKELLSMVPGASKALAGKEIDESAFKKTEAIILSMTMVERGNPSILNGSRRRRIAAGSGTAVRDVNELIRQFEQMKKMMKTMGRKGNLAHSMQNLTGLRR